MLSLCPTISQRFNLEERRGGNQGGWSKAVVTGLIPVRRSQPIFLSRALPDFGFGRYQNESSEGGEAGFRGSRCVSFEC